MTDAELPSIDALLEHRAWVSALARTLCADPHRADDIAQETWLSALRNPPRHHTALRAWLARVVRRRARDEYRARRRRQKWESEAPQREGPSAPDDAILQIEAHQRVVRAVVGLAEPYRTTIVLRFYKGLTPAEIARRTGTPVDTVKTRLRRGLEQMRERLQTDRAGEDDWRAAIMPVVFGTGGVAMKTSKVAAVAALLVALATGGVWWSAVRDADQTKPTETVVSQLPSTPAKETPRKHLAEAAPRRDASTSAFPGTASLRGEVRMRDGAKPVAGAAVVLADPAGRRGTTTTSDQTGRFEFPSIASGLAFKVRVETEEASCVPQVVRHLAENESRDVGVLWLDAFGAIEVTVETATGSPEGAVVEVYGSALSRWGAFSVWTNDEEFRHGGVAIASAHIDASGRARLRVPAGSLAVVVRKTGFHPRGPVWLDIRGGRTSKLSAVLEPGVRIEGRLIDGSRLPLSGRTVVARSGGYATLDGSGFAGFSSAVTEADGGFELDGLKVGPVTIQLRTGAGIMPLATVRAPSSGVIDFVVEFGSLEGQVTRVEDGQPVPGATVRVQNSASQGTAVLLVQTDAQGRYRIEGLSPGSFNGLYAEAPGYAPADPAGRTESFRSVAGGAVHVDLSVARAASVEGMVTSGDAPVSGASVQAHWYSGTGVLRRDTTTDAEGRYVASDIPTERLVIVQVIARGLSQDPWDPNWVSVLMGQGQTTPAWSVRTQSGKAAHLDLKMVAGRSVAGRVEDPSGAPIPGASVSAWMDRTVAGDDGKFRLLGVAVDGRGAILGTDAEGFVRTSTTLTKDGDVTDLRIVLHPAARNRGTVRLDDGGVVPPGTLVRVLPVEAIQWYPDESVAWRGLTPVRVQPDGTFEARLWTNSGAVLVRSEAPGFAQAPVTVNVAPQTQGYEVALVLAPAPRFEGRIVDDATDAPVAGVQIALDPAFSPTPGRPQYSRTPTLSALTGPSGTFDVSSLTPGKYEAKFVAPGYVEQSIAFVLPIDGPLTVRLHVSERLFAGFVLDSDRKPVGGALVIAEPEPRPPTFDKAPWMQTGADGRFELRGTPGTSTWTPMMYPPQGRGFPKRWVKLEGVALGRTDVEFVLQSSRRMLGRVLASDGTPARGISVRASCDNGGAAESSATTDDAGAFALDGLDDRAYDVRAEALSARHDEAWVSVCRDLPTTVRNIAAGREDVTIRLERGDTLAGTLVGDDGRALSGVWLTASPLSGQPEMDGRRAGHFPCGGRTDGEGRFAINGLAHGRYRVTRVEPNQIGGHPVFTPLVGGEDVVSDTNGVRLRVASLGVIEGRVLDEDGKPVDEASVVATFGTRTSVAWAKTAADGSFRLERLDVARAHVLEVTKTGAFLLERTDNVRPGARDVVVKLRRGLRATGRILDSDGKPVARVCVIRFVPDVGTGEFSIRTDAEGRFDVAGLVEGTYRVHAAVVQTASGRALHGSAPVHAGDRDVELRFVE